MEQEERSSTSNEDSPNESGKEQIECTVSEEYSVLPETFYSLPVENATREGGSFHKQKYEIFERLQKAIDVCSKRFSGRKELASEYDGCVAQLCESLEETFEYGLRSQQQSQLNFVVSAAYLFQNMQEIVTGSSYNKAKSNISASTNSCFWDFCHNFLTPHEKERFEKLKQVWTKSGKGRAFLRASLNEHSLQRYLLTWLSEEEILRTYYSHWSILMDVKMTKSLIDRIKTLDKVIFALSVDKTELNVAVKTTNIQHPVVKEEPVIFAPTPIKVEPKTKKSSVVERPIASTSSTDDILKQIEKNDKLKSSLVEAEKFCTSIEEIEAYDCSPPDPIEPELAFLKQPMVGSPIEKVDDYLKQNGLLEPLTAPYNDPDGDTSSQSSKYSANNLASQNVCNNVQHLQLEEQLKDVNDRCSLLETRVAQLSLENRQLIRRLKKHFEDSGIDPSSSFATNFLITIPHTKLQKSKHATSGSYHLYEIHITMRHNLEHWSLWRRYSDFNKLHKSLLKTHPSVSLVEFPPKKRFGNMNTKFVEERRQQLQIYLLNLVETLPQVEACKTKAELQKVFPFLRDHFKN